MRHLIDPMDLTVEEIDQLLAVGDDIIQHPHKYAAICKGKKLATLFYEPSTRTRLSFESAMLELAAASRLFLCRFFLRRQGRKRRRHHPRHRLLCGHRRHASS